MTSIQSRARRSSSVTSPTFERIAAELSPLLSSLARSCAQASFSLRNALDSAEGLLRLHHAIIDNAHSLETKGVFRRLQGFEILLKSIRSICDVYDPVLSAEEERRGLLSVLNHVLSLLSECLRDHPGNKRYFFKGLKDGIRNLQDSLSSIPSKLCSIPANESLVDTEHFYGALLASALGHETILNFFSTLRIRVSPDNSPVTSESVQASIQITLDSTETIENPEFLSPLLNLWLFQSSQNDGYTVLQLAIPLCLIHLARHSMCNLVALHSTGMLASLLSLVIKSDRPAQVKSLYRELAKVLCQHGVNTLQNAVDLYRNAHDSPDVSSFLVDAIKFSKNPPSIHFDLSRHGYSSIELPSLGKQFPPVMSNGYTLSLWARFDSFDTNTHTTLFGAYDTNQDCFVLAYLEKDTQNFILQTSIKGPRPSVRFKSIVFRPGKWYHICIVHKKPKSDSSSKASLFVNGEFVEQLKADYPVLPPHILPRGFPHVQTFLGTPEDLASKLGKNVSSTKWSLASAVLFDEAFADDIIFVFTRLGPRYRGNFQDNLGLFQTYRASTELHLRNENLHPGKGEQSDIVSTITRKASLLIPENSILLNISPTAILDDNDGNYVDESQLIKSLSKQAAKNLSHFTRSGSNAIAVNGAVPAINDALTHSHGIGLLMGDPVVTAPQSLDDAAFRISGCTSIGLSLVGAASTPEAMCLAVEALFESVQDNWRNSDAMERDHGYGILALLISEKLGLSSNIQSAASSVCATQEDREKLAMDLLILVLKFVGYDFQDPRKSIIINPLAFRILLVDLDVWRIGSIPLLKLYYSQFVVFSSESYYHHFNTKRLSRTRVVKRFIEALKGESLTYESIQLFLPTFKTLVLSCMSTEIFRSLALFVTYSIRAPQTTSHLQRKKSIRFESRSRRIESVQPPDANATFLTKQQLGIEVLKVYADIICDGTNTINLKRFARTVTNKWLLYLISEDEPEIVVLGVKMLARLLVIYGIPYTKKFSEKNGGFIIMRHRLKRLWRVPVLWPLCFAILLGQDVGRMDFNRPFDHFGFLNLFNSAGDLKIVYPDVLPVITGMIQSGLKEIMSQSKPSPETLSVALVNRPKRSMSNTTPERINASSSLAIEHNFNQDILREVIRFLSQLHQKFQTFRDFAAASHYIQELFFILYPVVVGSDNLSADLELNSHSSGLTLGGEDVVIQPLSNHSRPVLRTTTVSSSANQGNRMKRSSSFVLISSDKTGSALSPTRPRHTFSVASDSLDPLHADLMVQGILELIITSFVDQVLTRKDFSVFDIHSRIPPGFSEHQAYFESWLLRNILSQLKNTILLNKSLLGEPRLLINISRLLTYISDTVYEGWFIDGASATLEFVGPLLEYIQQPNVSSLKSVRLCSHVLSITRSVVFRLVLMRLSETEDSEALSFLKRLTYWQTILLSSTETQTEYFSLLCYLLYSQIISENVEVRTTTANLWRVVLVQKPSETAAFLHSTNPSLHKRLSVGFQELMSMDDVNFLQFVDDHRVDLDSFFFGTLSKKWEAFVREENSKTDDACRTRVLKRKEVLKQWVHADSIRDDTIRKHDNTFYHWNSNIFSAEALKYQRSLQDQQDNIAFLSSTFSYMCRELKRDNGVLADKIEMKWRLDQTEGRNRMRLRIIPDDTIGDQKYLPKRSKSFHESSASKQSSKLRGRMGADLIEMTADNERVEGDLPVNTGLDVLEESFEMIDDPRTDLDNYEDKNRKVMRSLRRGDQVLHLCNVSRIKGLEAVEGLVILGKTSVYILDNFFQRLDGEIVNVWQAPSEERDPYVRMISGRESEELKLNNVEHETRSWRWEEVVSVSKRRFLFRDVALEIFFSDGRSYLLTMIASSPRNELYNQLSTKAPHINGSNNVSRTGDTLRFETLKSEESSTPFFASKLVNAFTQTPSHPATRKWLKGEMSNFHYLMLINTLAGRTYNDLTQYPVFPWVLADYTSEELDLTNPKTFRDFSKPMGCQTPEREAEFRMRYETFREMSDGSAPPFHYGTHYSSAMIVSSYMIRLQPFVKSYLLLQGGTFDHADRLFYSIGKAWESASSPKGGLSDVRELIPEFFYLPEFLVNTNKYDFGLRQNMTQSIDSVELPPWAKGDPKIFITKHREALESPYVTKNLHHWIDLIFGFKQKGEAALEAVNVFHYLSYQGAKDVDTIEDPLERLATIGIIHNFGQTPHQVFQKPHPIRDSPVKKNLNRLDISVEALSRTPFTLLDSGERVASLLYSWKQDRLLCAAAFRLNIPPNYERYMEWGFSDNSVRFYAANSRKLIGHYEHLHIGQLSVAIFADSQTLITSGTDCSVSIWSFTSPSSSVELVSKAHLNGHRTPVTILAVSRSFSTVLSASKDGVIMLWDLNRLEFLRSLPTDGPVTCARINDATGNIMVCRNCRISLYTLNGDLILDQAACEQNDDDILSCAFYEGFGNEWLERELLFTGHRKGLVNIWNKVIRDGRFELDLIRQLYHIDNWRGERFPMAGISCILPLPHVVYTGDEYGRVYEWNCVQRQ